MKGIILAGGSGSRLYPMTLAVNKQLLPLYNKPLIYYPLSFLIDCHLTEILLITSPQAQGDFVKLLGDGSQFGINISYIIQPCPEGIAQALVLSRSFLQGQGCTLILGDNLFIAPQAASLIRRNAAANFTGALIFASPVQDPERYGVLCFAEDGKLVDIVEKPKQAPSPYAVTGLYCYDASATERAASLKPSARGELEITDLNRSYLKDGLLHCNKLSRGNVWLDTGTPNSLLDAADYVRIIETRQGILLGSPELSALRQGLISRGQLRLLAQKLAATAYGMQLLQLSLEDGT